MPASTASAMFDQLTQDLDILAQHRASISLAQSIENEVQCSIDTNRSAAWTVAFGSNAFEALHKAARARVSSLHLSRRALPLSRPERISKSKSKVKNTADLLASLGL